MESKRPAAAFDVAVKDMDRAEKAAEKATQLRSSLTKQGFLPGKIDMAEAVVGQILQERDPKARLSTVWASDPDPEGLAAAIIGYGLDTSVEGNLGWTMRELIKRRPNMETPEKAAKSIVTALPEKARSPENRMAIYRFFGLAGGAK
jgi:hypothetical protein